MAFYLNRYTNFIKRGTFAPVRFLDHTKDSLKKLENHPLLDDNPQTFIQDLFHHKYDLEK
ncbi:MAG TPA: hypothetical protein PK268_01450 [Enterococcus sp.]|nr:hypothetical protein [Enterococcus sp.]